MFTGYKSKLWMVMRMDKCVIIAEAGVNHNGDIRLAKKMVDTAKDAGADIVKFQSFIAGKMISRHAQKAGYQERTTGGNESQLEMVQRYELTWQEQQELYEYSCERGIEFLSTPFDTDSYRFLSSQLGLRKMKISSGDLTNAPLLYEIARDGQQVILSTGMAVEEEIQMALNVLACGYDRKEIPSCSFLREYKITAAQQKILEEKVILLHCTTEYPAPLEEVNLRAMAGMRETFRLPVGYSDHTEGIWASVVAAGLGASVIEKHFTLDKGMEGPDHKASLEPAELKEMVAAIRIAELVLGDGVKRRTQTEEKNVDIARKSLVAGCAIRQGDIFTVDNLAIKRPGSGLSPFLYWDLLGKPAREDYDEDGQIK